jgi:hypothetical protein
MHKRRVIVLALVAIFLFTFAVLSDRLTKKADSASLTSSSVTLANSRLSFKAPITSGAAGSSLITISGAAPDTTTRHLFPGDAVCFTDAGNNVCRDNTTYIVSSVPTDTTFNITTPLTTALTATDFAVATQSGNWSVGFTSVAQVPIGGSLVVTIPMRDSIDGSDSIPDSGSTIATGGFDLGTLGPSNFVLEGGTSCTPANWGTPVIATGSATTDHTITWTRASSICAATTAFTLTIGGPGVVNPAPITGHAQGTADSYGITIATKDSGGNVIDSSVPRVDPVEAVLISATVDETLSFVVAGLSSGSSYCGHDASVSATATSIPWGHFSAANTFVYAAQQLTVNTNAAAGYAVTIQENDQMGKNGNTCTGTAPSTGDYTFSAGTCIRDTTCDGTCSESVAADWTNATSYPGLGYSLASQSGTDAPFFYNEKTRSWSAKQLADKAQGGETAATIMSNSGPVSGSSIYVCYRITIPGNQPAGYYYNIAKYTATATF